MRSVPNELSETEPSALSERAPYVRLAMMTIYDPISVERETVCARWGRVGTESAPPGTVTVMRGRSVNTATQGLHNFQYRSDELRGVTKRWKSRCKDNDLGLFIATPIRHVILSIAALLLHWSGCLVRVHPSLHKFHTPKNVTSEIWPVTTLDPIIDFYKGP
jgi:hypothetical protein